MWDKIGKLAWEAGKKYVEYRGVDGTIADIGTLTDKAKNMFGGNNSRSNGNGYDSNKYDYDDVDDDTYDDVDDDDDSFDSNFDDFTNEYFALIDDDEYDRAIELTKGYYKANGLTRDYVFFYFIGNAQGYMSPDKLNASVSNLSQAKNMAPEDSEDYDMVCNRLDEVKGRQEYCVNFNSTMKRIDEYVASKDYEMAEATLSKFYKKYNNNVHDFFYWTKLFEIHGDSRMENSDDESADLNQLEEYLQEMSGYITGNPYYAETYDEKVAVYNAIEVSRLYADAKREAEKMADNGEFDRAIQIMDEYYRVNELKKDFCYWISDISRFHRLAVEQALKKGEIPTARFEAYQDAIFKAKEFVESENDESLYETAFDAYKELKARMATASDSRESHPVQASDSLTDSEREYLTELKECLEDGTISERENRLLDRLRKSLGISEQRAEELKEMASEKLTEAEKEYLTEYEACMADGQISDRERRLLDKLSKSLGITPARIAELEAKVSK